MPKESGKGSASASRVTDRGVDPLDQEDQDPAYDHRRDHDPVREEISLDDVVQERTQDRRREEGHDDREREAARTRIVRQADQRSPQPAEIEHADGEDGAELDDDLEDVGQRLRQTDDAVGEDQVAGRGDGQKLGQALDDAENGGLDEGVGIGHGRRSIVVRRPA